MAVGLCAFLLSHSGSPRALPEHIVPLVVIFSFVALATELKVLRGPAGEEKTVVSSVFIASILLLGPAYTIPSVLVAIVGSQLILGKPWYKVVFNTSMYLLTTGGSGVIYFAARTLGGRADT